eukprot:gnl/Hemi2/18042_TR5959_c0_g1_i1.p1 gnl/Hemi2/18042_TR5959_c0_g1~~gnl/Hemi2/18042_TR5959_c0_g1_i1.p1  ORF type:complete len:247 (+),score=40.64 gnl/Hemi2/18042_TR5959_c0_g1_i1:48-788(+)
MRQPALTALLVAVLLVGTASGFASTQTNTNNNNQANTATTTTSAGEAEESYKLEGRIVRGGGGDGAGGLGDLRPSYQRVLLNGGLFETVPRGDGRFVFSDVPAGSYLLEVNSPDFVFPSIRIDVAKPSKPGSTPKIRAVQAYTPLAQRRPLNYPLVLDPLERIQFTEQAEPFDIFKLLKSPVVMMIGFAVFGVIFLQKMMSTIDPEALRQMQEKMQENNAADGLMNRMLTSLSTEAPGKKSKRAKE